MLALKRLRTLRHVSILIDDHQGVRQCLVKVTEFKKSLSLKFLKVGVNFMVTPYINNIHHFNFQLMHTTLKK